MNGINKIKALALLLVMVIILGFAPGSIFVKANAEYPPDFEVKDGVLKSYKGNSTEVEIPNGIIDISMHAFPSELNMISVTIPASVKTMSTYSGVHVNPFRLCNKLTGIYVDIANSYFKDEDGVLFSKDGRTLWAFPANNPLADYVVPDTVNIIAKNAFADCQNLTSITIPASVEDVGKFPFYNNNLVGIYVDSANLCYKDENGILFSKNGDTLIKFPSHSAFSEYVIPNTVTYISEYAFSSCNNLTSVDIPNSVIEIGHDAFNRCKNLTSVNIPNSIKKIGDYVFMGCENLTSVDIPNSVTSIGYGAFWLCENLTSADIPNSVISIDKWAFSKCYSLTSIDIPNSVTYIGDKAFSFCINLTSVDIPNSVKKIGDDAFAGCDESFTIFAPSSSYAEQYAKDNNIAFSATSSNTSLITPEVTAGNDPAVGSYALASVSEGDRTLTAEQITASGQDVSGYSLDINADGRFTVTFMGIPVEGTWTNNGNEYLMQDRVDTTYGQYNASDMTFTLEIQYTETSKSYFVFSKINASSSIPDIPVRNDPAVGSYEFVGISIGGTTVSAEEMAASGQEIDDYSLEINADGSFSMSIMGMTVGTWKNNGNEYVLTTGYGTLYGYYSASYMTFVIEIQHSEMFTTLYIFIQNIY